MTTQVETALAALAAALASAAGQEGSALVAPIRDAYAHASLQDGDRVVNVIKGGLEHDVTPVDTLLGEGDGLEEFYQHARVELTCASLDAPARRLAVDTMAAALAAALVADRTLGGACATLEIDAPIVAEEDLSGQAGVSTLVVPVRLLLDAATFIG